jgi:hypothetical protein
LKRMRNDRIKKTILTCLEGEAKGEA